MTTPRLIGEFVGLNAYVIPLPDVPVNNEFEPIVGAIMLKSNNFGAVVVVIDGTELALRFGVIFNAWLKLRFKTEDGMEVSCLG